MKNFISEKIFDEITRKNYRRWEQGQHSQNLLIGSVSSGLYYKNITIVIMTIVSDATIWSITYDRNWWGWLRLKQRLRPRWSTFIVQALFMIVTYDRQNIFIIQATGLLHNELERLATDKHSNLLGLFVSYEENKMLWIRTQVSHSQHFFFFVIYSLDQ